MAARKEEEDHYYDRALSSDINMAGGGGIVISPTDAEPLTMKERARTNLFLCGSGAVNGLGMFTEAYILFAIGNIKPIWKKLYPECYTKGTDCNYNLVSSLTYIEVVGVIVGMLTFGFFADTFGRRIGSCSTASIMAIGAVLTAAASGADINGQWIMFAVVLFFFSYGVGGEYPLASASAAERAETARETNNYVTQLRGKTVVLTFAMQGVGNFINTLIIVLILLGENCTGSTCDSKSYEITWRLQYAIGAFVVCCLAVGRIVFLKESEVWKKAHEERQEGENKDRLSRSRKLMFVKYWHRLVGTAVGWFVWDIVFYGNKLFQGKIIATIVGSDATIYTTLKYTLLNSGIALIGYYVAAFTIDKKWMGRRRMQTIGFTWIFALFLICGVAYDKLILPENIKYFQALYLLSSFWGQLGPNSTTWLLPSELFPTDVRSQAHGISAASGKCGALFATLLFTYGSSGDALDSQIIFIVCAVCGIVGLFVTQMFVPDVSQMDLRHADDRWNFILEGREEEYNGDAVRPEFLSHFERCTGHARTGDDFTTGGKPKHGGVVARTDPNDML